MTKQVEGLWVVTGIMENKDGTVTECKARVCTTEMGRDMAIKAAQKPWIPGDLIRVQHYPTIEGEVYYVQTTK